MFRRIRKAVAIIIMAAFISTSVRPPAYAQEPLNLPLPGTMVSLSLGFVPVLIKGLKVHPENPLLFDFILDTGKSGLKVNSPEFKAESEKLIKYFLASLTIKEDDLWVNLSPYEKDRMIPEELGKTELGRDMLAQDYILKQLTASLIYPEKQLGQEFWNRVYAKAQQMYGTVNVPVDTFNKVWIVADKAKVLERKNVAYVIGAHLKVMLEEDYLALGKHQMPTKGNSGTHSIASQIVREIILPELEKEVNQGKNFASLRQIFYSMILATWYRQALKGALLNQVYSNKGKTGGVLSDDPTVKEKIYQQYLQAYKKGVFNYIREDTANPGLPGKEQGMLPRKYFSGGLARNLGIRIDLAQSITPKELADMDTGDLAMVDTDMTRQRAEASAKSPAMLHFNIEKIGQMVRMRRTTAYGLTLNSGGPFGNTFLGLIERTQGEIRSIFQRFNLQGSLVLYDPQDVHATIIGLEGTNELTQMPTAADFKKSLELLKVNGAGATPDMDPNYVLNWAANTQPFDIQIGAGVLSEAHRDQTIRITENGLILMKGRAVKRSLFSDIRSEFEDRAHIRHGYGRADDEFYFALGYIKPANGDDINNPDFLEALSGYAENIQQNLPVLTETIDQVKVVLYEKMTIAKNAQLKVLPLPLGRVSPVKALVPYMLDLAMNEVFTPAAVAQQASTNYGSVANYSFPSVVAKVRNINGLGEKIRPLWQALRGIAEDYPDVVDVPELDEWHYTITSRHTDMQGRPFRDDLSRLNKPFGPAELGSYIDEAKAYLKKAKPMPFPSDQDLVGTLSRTPAGVVYWTMDYDSPFASWIHHFMPGFEGSPWNIYQSGPEGKKLFKVYMTLLRIKKADVPPETLREIDRRVGQVISEFAPGDRLQLPGHYSSNGVEVGQGNYLNWKTVNIEHISDPAMNEVVKRREYNFASAGLTVNLHNPNNNVARVNAGTPDEKVVSVGSFMMMRNLAPDAKDFPSIFITPQGPWVGDDGSNLMQVYFPVFANWGVHKRKTVIIVRNAEERKRVEQYLRYGNEFDRPADLEYLPAAQAAELKRESYYLADRFVMPGSASPRIVNTLKDFVDIYTMEEAKAKIGLEIKDLPTEGAIEVKDKTEVFKLQATHLKEFELSLPPAVEPLKEHPNFGVTFLGTSSAMDPDGLGVGHIVWAGQTNFLYDLNPSAVLGLRKLGLSPRDINYVVVTHTHEDHVAGTLAYLNWAKEQGVKVKIIAEPVVWYYLKRLVNAETDQELEKLFNIEYIPMRFYEDLHLSNGQVLLESAPAFHGTTVAMTRITYQGRTIALSSDTTMVPKRFAAIRENRLPGFIQEELRRLTGWDGQHPIMTEQRIDELDGSLHPQDNPGFLFKPNHSGKNPELVVYETGFPRNQPTEEGDLTNHTSAYDLEPLAAAFPQTRVITNHSASLPAGANARNLTHARAFTSVSLDKAMNDLGGISLNAKNMGLDITKEGQGIDMKFDPAMIAEFQRGDFSGIVPVIIRITPLRSALPLLGF